MAAAIYCFIKMIISYEEFKQAPAEFADDLTKVLLLKKKWGLEFTREERRLRGYVLRLQAEVLSGLLNE